MQWAVGRVRTLSLLLGLFLSIHLVGDVVEESLLMWEVALECLCLFQYPCCIYLPSEVFLRAPKSEGTNLPSLQQLACGQ